ncbi:MAG TPA: GRP family sugar transporter [Chitinophaga sp.]|uniref:GRP family sugar transporter n=1 Tax=Chitinophaga sp. TaxID=1869181 RepID=UPI002DBB08E6|nr:GRP family sugar transporter [Chitinophaga sp.]HEU4552304.1 GRP family sugar transporter [Chitinophaga sp.]
MFIVESYSLAVIFCLITMLCWGSWANTQKLAAKEWRFELFYWDYVAGILLLSIIGAFSLGSHGTAGRPFIADLTQAASGNISSAFIGGVVFNLANILLTAAIAGAGMAVAFPVGIGLALVIGVVLNYALAARGNPLLLFSGVLLVTLAIITNAVAYGKHSGSTGKRGVGKWISVAIIAGILMSSFYPFIAAGMDLENPAFPAAGKMTAYTAFVVFAAGIFISNLLFNTILMRRPLNGPPIRFSTYLKGRPRLHLTGLLGGCIWGVGNLFNLIASGKAGPAISYGLGQGATLVAALWGVLVWKEFKGSSPAVNRLVTGMFILFITGLGLIIAAGR